MISVAVLLETVNNFLNSEWKTVSAENRVNSFLNNAEQKLSLCEILEIVYAENSEYFYEKTMKCFN